jgi:hypothetical protein
MNDMPPLFGVISTQAFGVFLNCSIPGWKESGASLLTMLQLVQQNHLYPAVILEPSLEQLISQFPAIEGLREKIEALVQRHSLILG